MRNVPFFRTEGRQGSSQDSPSKLLLRDILIPLGSILIAAISLLTVNFKLPAWAIIGVVSYLIVVIVALLFNPFHGLCSFLWKMKRERYLAKKFHSEVYDISREFNGLIEDRSDTISNLLKDINSWEELRGQLIQPDSEHISTIKSWHASIEKDLNLLGLRYFPSLVWDLGVVISQYNRFCIQMQKRLEEILRERELHEMHLRYLKHEWTLRRERHIRVISKWESLTKNINDKFRGRLCIDYYEPLKPID